MSFAYTEIVTCAERIIGIVGPGPNPEPMLGLTGRYPCLPESTFKALVGHQTYNTLEPTTRQRASIVLEQRLQATRHQLARQYHDSVKHLFSLGPSGIPDAEVEALLIQAFEARYQDHLREIGHMLAKIFVRLPSLEDSRNTRGGFGDVSLPSQLKLKIQRTLLILETAFSHTKSPLASEIEHLSRLTSLEPHQVSPRSPYPSLMALHTHTDSLGPHLGMYLSFFFTSLHHLLHYPSLPTASP